MGHLLGVRLANSDLRPSPTVSPNRNLGVSQPSRETCVYYESRIETNMERGAASLGGSSRWCLREGVQVEEAVAHAARVQAHAVRDAAVVQCRGACLSARRHQPLLRGKHQLPAVVVALSAEPHLRGGQQDWIDENTAG